MARFIRQTRGQVRLLVSGTVGPECVIGYRDPDTRGVQVAGVTYPDELLRYLGEDTYLLATEVTMPADGDTTHSGAFKHLQPVDQLGFTASWADYDRGRRRLNGSALFARGSGVSEILSNLSKAAMVIALLFILWSTVGLRGSLSSTNERIGTQNDLLVRVIPAASQPGAVVSPLPTAGAPTVTVGPPATNRRTPTPGP